MAKKKTKKPSRQLTILQKRAMKHLMEKGGTVAAAMRAAGYTAASVKNPDKLTKSIGFAAVLEKEGLTDNFIAKKYSRLLNATRIETQYFDMWKMKGRWCSHTDEDIKRMIEGTKEFPTGNEIVTINTDTRLHRRIVTFRHPDNMVQKSMIELTGKVKSHFAPEKIDLVDHTLTEDEAAKLQEIFSTNKK